MLVRLKEIESNRVIGTTDTRFEHRWPWIQDTVSEHSGCDPESVATLETDDGDIITADGKPFARLEHKYGWAVLGCGEWA